MIQKSLKNKNKKQLTEEKCFTEAKKLRKILQNLKRYKFLDMLVRMVDSQWILKRMSKINQQKKKKEENLSVILNQETSTQKQKKESVQNRVLILLKSKEMICNTSKSGIF